ncbi:MAG: tetratricopeptide repeat protein [Vicinamibacterales bacterium]
MEQQLPEASEANEEPEATPAALRRELGIVVLLAMAGALGFLGARVMAHGIEARRRVDAKMLFERGRTALEQGRVNGALKDLRKAAVIDRSDRTIAVYFARALRAAHEDAEAASVLGRLHSSQPDDVDVNVELARVEAARGDLTRAVRNYEDALENLWDPTVAERSRALRLELIELLLRSGLRSRALSHVLLLSADLPADKTWQMRAGELFLEAGDAKRAAAHFAAARQAAPDDPEALAGSARAAFELGNYTHAANYLNALNTPATADLKATVNAVLHLDPLAAHLSTTDRSQRLVTLLRFAQTRLAACTSAGPRSADMSDAARSLDALLATLPPARDASAADRERLESGLDLAVHVSHLTAGCAANDATDRAVVLIARSHGLTEAS